MKTEQNSPKETTPFDRLNDELGSRLDLETNDVPVVFNEQGMGTNQDLDDITKPPVVETPEEGQETAPIDTSTEASEEETPPDVPEGEEATIEDEQEFDVVIEGNAIAALAKQWQTEGKLPEDIEIGDDFSEEQLETAFYSNLEKNATEELKAQVIEDVMREEGLSPKAIADAKKLHYGVTDESLRKAQIYENLSSVTLDPTQETYEDNIKELGMYYYMDRKFSPEQAERHVNADLNGEVDVEELITEYQTHFRNEAISLNEAHDAKIQEQKLADERRRTERLGEIKTLLDKGEIAGHKYTKEQIAFARRAMFDRTETYTDKAGNRHRVTLEQKKIQEYKKDPEKYLKTRIDFLLGYDLKAIKEEAKVAAKNSVLKELNITVKPRVATPIKGEAAKKPAPSRRVPSPDAIEQRII